MKNKYINRVYNEIKSKSQNEPEFIQALEEVLFSLEDYIEKCKYSISTTSTVNANNNFKVYSSGELTAKTEVENNASRNICSLTLTYGSTTQTIYVRVVSELDVSYSIVGADTEGLTNASNQSGFYFEQYIRSNYGGIPTSFTIKIGNTNINLTENPKANNNIKIYEINEKGEVGTTPISKYSIDAYGYAVEIASSLVTNDISISVTYPIVYTITLKLQCDKFNPGLPEEETEKTFKIQAGTKIDDYFNTLIDEIDEWTEKATIFGFIFNGFFLVNEAGSISSYGVSFNDLILQGYSVNSSLTFYARWSYLIELVEASGTKIESGFDNSFMQEYIEDNFTHSIYIPINANKGYVFRVDTESHYVGKPGVEAYIVKEINGEKIKEPIEIEMYEGSNSLYYIRPEYITGYLLIMTTVSNSEVIVGENTSAVTENVTPEDGIVTFKYIVNHYNDGVNKSYIFNLDSGKSYKDVKKEFVLDFYRQSDYADVKLPDNTEIRVYYNRYDNGSTTPSYSVVGTYITNNDDRVFLSEFTTLDLETQAFPSNLTFANTLDNKKSVTEVYYFTITPPNGYSENVSNEMIYYIVECGYCYEKVEYGETVNYLTGKRNGVNLANPDLNDVVDEEYGSESARQYKPIFLTPTRKTILNTNGDGTYTFVDDKTYDLYDIILTDTQIQNNTYISLYDDSRQSILESGELKSPIKQLRLTLGYRLGLVSIYGFNPETNEWEKLGELNVTQAVYQEYIIDFQDKNKGYTYTKFKIDNISTNEIRLTKVDVVSARNNILYEGNINQFNYKEEVSGKYVYTLNHAIEGDSRHDGKTFMLAIQLKDSSGNIVNSLPANIYVVVNNAGIGTQYHAYLDSNTGKTTAYINLSTILNQLQINEINFNIYIPDGYEIHSVQLIEVSNEFKPSSGEVRIN